MVTITRREFERLVEQALGELPRRFADLLDNVAIVVEDEPSDEDRELLEPGGELLGIFRGLPRTERAHDTTTLPNQIAIFRGPIIRVSRNVPEALEQIRDTVIHELGHYFGLDDEAMIY